MDRWVGKTAVVTGAGSGIGKAITLALLRNRVNVTALEIQKERLTKLEEEYKRDNILGKLLSICCDVSIENEIDEAFSTIEKTFGGVDIMVNCAGILYFTRIIGTFALNKYYIYTLFLLQRSYNPFSATHKNISVNKLLAIQTDRQIQRITSNLSY